MRQKSRQGGLNDDGTGNLPGSPGDVLGGNRRSGGEGENGNQTAMNSIRKPEKLGDQSPSAGVRRLRRFAARVVLGVAESLKGPQGRAPSHHRPITRFRTHPG